MTSYRLSPEAEADLNRIWNYGSRSWGTSAADRYYLKLINQFERIAANPLQYPAVYHIRQGYRRSMCGRDSIYYRVTDDVVEIMSIIGRQNVHELL